jgi:hypothetical protein
MQHLVVPWDEAMANLVGLAPTLPRRMELPIDEDAPAVRDPEGFQLQLSNGVNEEGRTDQNLLAGDFQPDGLSL